MTAKEKIIYCLRGGPLSDAEIAAAIGAPMPSVRRCRGELLVDRLIEADREHADGSMMWRLPQAASTLTRSLPISLKSRPPESRPAPGNIVHF